MKTLILSLLIVLCMAGSGFTQGYIASGSVGGGSGTLTPDTGNTNHYLTYWTGPTTLGGKQLAANHYQCTDGVGEPGACTGTETLGVLAGLYQYVAGVLTVITPPAAGTSAVVGWSNAGVLAAYNSWNPVADYTIFNDATAPTKFFKFAASLITAGQTRTVYAPDYDLYFPVTAGSTGQLMRSAGGTTNAPTWTTATYPATAGTSGYVLSSDGTNFVSQALTGAQLPAALTPTTIELGHASDTTIARVGAGVISVEGVTIPRIIGSGASLALDFGSTLTGACATVIQVACTNCVATDVVIFNANASIKAVTGYVPASTGGFSIAAFPDAGHVNFEACNWTAGTVDPGSITVNWMVIR